MLGRWGELRAAGDAGGQPQWAELVVVRRSICGEVRGRVWGRVRVRGGVLVVMDAVFTFTLCTYIQP